MMLLLLLPLQLFSSCCWGREQRTAPLACVGGQGSRVWKVWALGSTVCVWICMGVRDRRGLIGCLCMYETEGARLIIFIIRRRQERADALGAASCGQGGAGLLPAPRAGCDGRAVLMGRFWADSGDRYACGQANWEMGKWPMAKSSKCAKQRNHAGETRTRVRETSRELDTGMGQTLVCVIGCTHWGGCWQLSLAPKFGELYSVG